jgi:hypothetical protein
MQVYDCQDLLLVSRQFDKLKVYFSHLVDTLRYLTSTEADQAMKFAQLLPPNAALQLASENKLPPQYVFQIMRCALPPIYKQTPQEFKETSQLFWSVLKTNLQLKIDTSAAPEYSHDAKYWNEHRFQQTKLQEIQDALMPELYTLFWYISLPNLYVPTSAYTDEVKRLTQELDEVKQRTPQNKKEIERLSKLCKAMQ